MMRIDGLQGTDGKGKVLLPVLFVVLSQTIFFSVGSSVAAVSLTLKQRFFSSL